MKTIQSVHRGSRCTSMQLWHNVTACAMTHTTIWEVTELSSQELRLLSHWKLGSNSSSAACKPCDPERGLISTSAKREGGRAAETKAKKQRESSTCGNRETRVYAGKKNPGEMQERRVFRSQMMKTSNANIQDGALKLSSTFPSLQALYSPPGSAKFSVNPRGAG